MYLWRMCTCACFLTAGQDLQSVRVHVVKCAYAKAIYCPGQWRTELREEGEGCSTKLHWIKQSGSISKPLILLQSCTRIESDLWQGRQLIIITYTWLHQRKHATCTCSCYTTMYTVATRVRIHVHVFHVSRHMHARAYTETDLLRCNVTRRNLPVGWP